MSKWYVDLRGSGKRVIEADKHLVTGDGDLFFFRAQPDTTMFQVASFSRDMWVEASLMADDPS